MSHDIEHELCTRPTSGTAVSLVAQRLRLEMMDTRNGLMHDHTVRGQPDASMTVAPAGSLDWSFNAELVWKRVAWCERFGNAPIAFEVGTSVSLALSGAHKYRFARELAGFVARDMSLPVTFSVVDGNTSWPLREDESATVRICFPTRTLALADGSNAVGAPMSRPVLPAGL